MQVLRSLFARFSSARAVAAPVSLPVALSPEQLGQVAGGLPRVGPVAPTVPPALPRVG